MDQRPAMIMVAPLVIQTDQVTSVITLVNSTGLNAGVTISVRAQSGAQSGAELTHLHLVLSKHQQVKMPVSVLMESVPHIPELSSIAVTQDATVKGMAVAAQLVITDNREATPSYIDEELEMPSIDGSNTVRAVTDDTDGNALVAVTNTEDQGQTVTLRCVEKKGTSSAARIPIEANATLFFHGCTTDQVSSLKSYSSSLQAPSGYKDEHRIEGMEISGDGSPGSLVGFAVTPHFRSGSSILSAVPFYDPALQRSSNFVFAGVPTGPQPTLPDGIYIPRISLANFSAQSAHVTISGVDSTEVDTSKSDAGTPSTYRKLRDLTIPAGRSLEVVLDGASSQGGLLHSIRVTSDRKPGEVMGKLVSRSDGNLYQIELLGKDELDHNNGGMHPWSTENDAESHLLLFNHSSTELTFDVAIYNAVGGWDKKYKLAPYETREISINQIASEKIKDDKGRVLEPNYRSGTVNWMVPDSGTATGRLMVTSHTAMMARNYSCGNYAIICDFSITTLDGGSMLEGEVTAIFDEDVGFCTPDDSQSCNGSTLDSGSATYSNTISPTSIIQFSDSNQSSRANPSFYGAGRGTGSGYLKATAGFCSGSGPISPIVQVPTAEILYPPDVFSNALPSSTRTCPANSVGWDREVEKQVVDQNSDPIYIDGQVLTEQFTISGTTNQLEITYIETHTGTTNAADLDEDEYYVCSKVCYGAGSSGQTLATQSVVDTPPGSSTQYPLTPNAISYKCKSITVNGN